MPAQKILKPEGQVLVVADTREFVSAVAKELSLLGATVNSRQLKVGDYILSERVAVERKTAPDFLESIFDQRIFEQIRALKETFEKPILLIEGYDLYSHRNVHPNAVRGALASIAVDYSIPILWTEGEKDTAGILYWIARREQIEEKRSISIRGERKPLSLKEQQEYLVAGLPGINRVRAAALLSHLKTPEKVFSASEEQLHEVVGIGEKTIKTIRKVLAEFYK